MAKLLSTHGPNLANCAKFLNTLVNLYNVSHYVTSNTMCSVWVQCGSAK